MLRIQAASRVLTRSRSFGGSVIRRGSLGPAENASSLQAVESSRITRYATPVGTRCVTRYAAGLRRVSAAESVSRGRTERWLPAPAAPRHRTPRSRRATRRNRRLVTGHLYRGDKELSGRRGDRPRSTTRRELYTYVIEHSPSRRHSSFVRLQSVADALRMSTFLVAKAACPTFETDTRCNLCAQSDVSPMFPVGR
jgi:hypothetical protein